MIRRKVVAPDGEAVIVGASTMSKLLLKCPNVVQHCSVAVYDDGKEREPGTLIVFTRGKQWTVLAKDPDTGSKLVVTQDTIDEALLGLDLLLGSPDTQWERDDYARSGRKRRSKGK